MPKTLILLVAAGASIVAAGCSSLTSPPEREIDPAPAQPAPKAAPAVAPAQVIPAQVPVVREEEKIQASHVLVAFKGARSTAVNRTREQAKKRAEEVLKKAKKGRDFAALAREYSDDPGTGARGGDLGSFTKTSMVRPFAEAAFGLRPGELSSIVETEFGFHIIKRAP